MDKELKAEKIKETEFALRHWSEAIQVMLKHKFGKGKVGHLILIFDFANFGHSMSFISDARHTSLIQLLEHFLVHLKDEQSKLIKPI